MEVCMVEDEKSRMVAIISYIEFGEQPQDKAKPRRLRCRTTRCAVIEGILYMRGYILPY